MSRSPSGHFEIVGACAEEGQRILVKGEGAKLADVREEDVHKHVRRLNSALILVQKLTNDDFFFKVIRNKI